MNKVTYNEKDGLKIYINGKVLDQRYVMVNPQIKLGETADDIPILFLGLYLESMNIEDIEAVAEYVNIK